MGPLPVLWGAREGVIVLQSVDLMTDLCIQAEPVAGVCIQARLLAGLSNHLWLGRVIGYVPWKGRVVLLIVLCNWAGPHAGLHNHLWSGEAPSHAPWLDGVIGRILHTFKAIVQLNGTSGCAVWSGDTVGYTSKLSRAADWDPQLSTLLGLCSALWRGLLLDFLFRQGYHLYPVVGWSWRFCSIIGLSCFLGSSVS